MRVRMLETRRGSNDGVRVETHAEGVVVDVSDDLGGVYVREGWAVAHNGAERAEAKPAASEAPKAAVTKPKRNAAQNGPAKRKGGKRA